MLVAVNWVQDQDHCRAVLNVKMSGFAAVGELNGCPPRIKCAQLPFGAILSSYPIEFERFRATLDVNFEGI